MPSPSNEESTGISALDARLAEGVLKGDRGTERALVWAGAFLIIVVGVATYLPAFSIPVHGEDGALLAPEAGLQHITTCVQALDLLPHAPLTAFGLALNWFITRGPAGLHAVSVLLHVLNALLLYLICRHLLTRPKQPSEDAADDVPATSNAPEGVAMLAGMIYAVHPLASESVLYLSARPQLQGTFFALCAILAFLQGARKDPVGYGAIFLSMALYGLSFGSLFSLWALPIILFAMHLTLHGWEAVRRLQRCWAIYASLMALLLVVYLAAGYSLQLSLTRPGLGYALGLLGQIFRLSVAPFGLQLRYGGGDALAQSSLFLGILPVILLAIAPSLLSRGRVSGIVWCWFGIAALCMPLFIPASQAALERNGYFALAGFALLLPSLFAYLPNPGVRAGLGIASAVLVLGMGYLSYQRAALWQDPAVLWSGEAENAPESVQPWHYLASHLTLQAELAEDVETKQSLTLASEEPWRKAHALNPEDPEILRNLGITLYRQQALDEALEVFMEALRRDPFDQRATLHVAAIHEARAAGEAGPEGVRKAIEYYARANALGPMPSVSLERYGLALAALGNIEESIPLLRQAAEGRPDSPVANTVKQFQAIAQQVAKLEQNARAQLTQDPKSVTGALARIEAQMIRGAHFRAFYLLDRIIQREAYNTQPWVMMGIVRARLADTEGFLNEWGEKRVGQADVWRDLALRCAAVGSWDAAQTYLEYDAAHREGAALPRITLARIATELNQAPRAQELLRQAAEAVPASPDPWLELADLASAAKDRQATMQLLAEAEKRNAPAEAIATRREKAGIGEEETLAPVRTIIR